MKLKSHSLASTLRSSSRCEILCQWLTPGNLPASRLMRSPVWLRLLDTEFSSVQDGIYAFGKDYNYILPTCLSEVSPVLPLKQFQCSSDYITRANSRPFKKDLRAFPHSVCLSSRQSMLSLAMCLQVVVSSSSTLRIIQNASHL